MELTGACVYASEPSSRLDEFELAVYFLFVVLLVVGVHVASWIEEPRMYCRPIGELRGKGP